MDRNANQFKISRMFYGDDKEPRFVVEWETSWNEEDEDGENVLDEEDETDFGSLDEAFEFARSLLAEADRIGREDVLS